MEAQQFVLSSTVVKLEYFIMLTPLQLSIPDEDSDVMAISRRCQRQYLDIHVHAHNSWPIWNKLEFSRYNRIKVLKIKFHANSSSRSRTDIRRTDRHIEANRRFSRLMLNVPKRWPWPSLGSSRFTPVQPYQWLSSCSEILLFEEKVSLSTVLAIKHCCSDQNLALTALCSNSSHMFAETHPCDRQHPLNWTASMPILYTGSASQFYVWISFLHLPFYSKKYIHTDLDSLWNDDKVITLNIKFH